MDKCILRGAVEIGRYGRIYRSVSGVLNRSTTNQPSARNGEKGIGARAIRFTTVGTLVILILVL